MEVYDYNQHASLFSYPNRHRLTRTEDKCFPSLNILERSNENKSFQYMPADPSLQDMIQVLSGIFEQ